MVTDNHNKVLGDLAVDAANAPAKMAEFFEKTIPPFLNKKIVPLKTEPRLPTLPFIWSYDPVIQQKLRKKYLRKLPKGSRGGRYRRTHNLINAWTILHFAIPGLAEAQVLNHVPYLETVQGDQQYPSHKDSGWVQYDGVLETASVEAMDMLIKRWDTILAGDDP